MSAHLRRVGGLGERQERGFFIDNLLVRVHGSIEAISVTNMRACARIETVTPSSRLELIETIAETVSVRAPATRSGSGVDGVLELRV